MILLLIILYAIAHGLTNAVCYSRKGSYALTMNEHVLFGVERDLLLLTALGATCYAFLPCLFEVLAGLFLFSWFHNGGYYIMRDMIARGGRHWWDSWRYQSKTDTSKYSFDYEERTLLLIVGLVLLVVCYAVYFCLR
ncbi:hypothetical protein [Pontibacter rugosus]|uniref:Uncharacterized protein n=1 Tax=Pontibacter rugosus TaxID=1745966 RepID=A0ABW3SJB9_9BACT